MKTLLGLILAVGLGVMLYAGFRTRFHEREDLDTNVATSSLLTFSVGHPLSSAQGSESVFPANIQPLVETPIYARTNGYLKRWLVDMGTHVESGQLLAEIETPEVDQSLKQAQATVTSLQASVDFDRSTATRYQQLLKQDGVSQQEVDQSLGTLHTDEGKLAGAVADVDRWKQMQSFREVRAPFTGYIHYRNIDTGALVSAGTGTVLFRLADVSTLRVYANVAEDFSHSIKVGMPAQVEVPSNPGQRYAGTVARTSGSLDPGSRTLLVEVQVPNPKLALVPGEYCQVWFKLKSPTASLIVPASAVLFRAEGAQVAVVDAPGESKVHLRSVKLGRDYGRSVEVLSGVSAEDTMIVNPSDSISEGQMVKAVMPKAPAPTAKQ